jgi:proteasome lid subunit RPN8/RPN11
VRKDWSRSAPSRLVFGPDVNRALRDIDWSSRHEQCGVIFGYGIDDVAVCRGMAKLNNVAKEPEHSYQFEPWEQAHTWERIEAMGLAVLGVWHTHPAGPVWPSETDLAYMQPWLLYPLLVPGQPLKVFKLRPMVYERADDSTYTEPAVHSQYDVVPWGLSGV